MIFLCVLLSSPSKPFLSLYRRGQNVFACQALVIERGCGTVAMNAYAEITQKIKPYGPHHIRCEEKFHLLPAVIRLRKVEEETARSFNEILRKRK